MIIIFLTHSLTHFTSIRNEISRQASKIISRHSVHVCWEANYSIYKIWREKIIPIASKRMDEGLLYCFLSCTFTILENTKRNDDERKKKFC
jgi:hypothetical protein